VRQSVVYSEVDISPGDIQLEISGVKFAGVSVFNAYIPPSNSFNIEAFHFLSALRNVVYSVWILTPIMASRAAIYPTAMAEILVGFIKKYDYVILNTAVPTYFCLTGHVAWNMLDLRFNNSFKFGGFVQFQRNHQRSPWQRSYSKFY